MKAKSLSALLILALLLALCAGCTIHINPSAGITTNDSFHYSTYDNAADYTAGRFTYQAEDIWSPLTGVTTASGDTPTGYRVYDACRGSSVFRGCRLSMS